MKKIAFIVAYYTRSGSVSQSARCAVALAGSVADIYHFCNSGLLLSKHHPEDRVPRRGSLRRASPKEAESLILDHIFRHRMVGAFRENDILMYQ